ncbi:citrate transporter [Methanocalculus chunghsingensis]|uniref:Citrate transporter n=1 Tax=Methanocalculus chunghsingensis TaxID=156457 RepID=A0A8J7W5Y1_9EURY|nr:SLC13 family permease [Methanocalculus chunghsingensis]MBR1368974.1 citrate transporter [Methanocalculus chunghsingensis]
METGILLVILVLTGTVILFITERIRIDVVAILAAISLAWLGLVTPMEAVSGFASNAVIAMASVMILGYGIERTGITSRLAAAIVRYAGTGERRVNATVSMTVGLLSSVMQNIGAAALFLPAMRRISRQTSIPVSRLMMPMGFAAILGGSVTMIGSGPLIVLNDLLTQADAEPFSLFAVTPIGLALLIAGVGLFAFFGERILPKKEEEKRGPTVAEIWDIDHPIWTCTIPPTSPFIGKTREEAFFKLRYGLDLLAVRTYKEITVAPSRYTRLEPGQELAFLGTKEDFERFVSDSGCSPPGSVSRLRETLDGEGYGFAELIVRPKASIVGQSIREIGFRQRFSIEPIVHQSGETETRADFSDTPLTAGDTIVAFGSWDALRVLAGNRDLLLLTHPEVETIRHDKGVRAVMIFAAALLLTGTGVPLSLALLTGAAGMILFGILTPDEVYRAVEWKTIALIGGLIPLGIAMEKTGAAALVATSLTGTLSGTHPIIIMAAVAILATILSLIISNVAATVLLVPLVMLTGAGTGVDPRALALLVAVCASNSFILPTHQVNALLMAPGGYSTRDYLKAGSVMTIIFIGIAVTLIYILIA